MTDDLTALAARLRRWAGYARAAAASGAVESAPMVHLSHEELDTLLDALDQQSADATTIADRIVADLFRDGAGNESQRLVMETDREKLRGSGWCRAAVRDRVLMALGDLRAQQSADAELGRRLREVEERWPQSRYDLRILRELGCVEDGSVPTDTEPPWFVEVNDPVESVEGIAVGTGPALLAALRQLLGVDGG